MIATGNHEYSDSLRGAPPLKKPLRRIAVRCPKMFRFLNTYNSKAVRFFLVAFRKSEHFREAVGDAAGVSKGGAFS
jgi:hypothetical protein